MEDVTEEPTELSDYEDNEEEIPFEDYENAAADESEISKPTNDKKNNIYVTDKTQFITIGVLTENERVRAITMRTATLSKDPSTPLSDEDVEGLKPREVAELELKRGVMPIKIMRQVTWTGKDGNVFEIHNINDLIGAIVEPQ